VQNNLLCLSMSVAALGPQTKGLNDRSLTRSKICVSSSRIQAWRCRIRETGTHTGKVQFFLPLHSDVMLASSSGIFPLIQDFNKKEKKQCTPRASVSSFCLS
jgi:hypothetical protein